MPGIVVVAILGRPLRASYCHAYLASRPAEDTLVAIVPDAASAQTMPAGTRSIVVPIQITLGRDGLSGRSAKAWMLRRMRSGSTTGVRVEQWLRQMRDMRRRTDTRSKLQAGVGREIWGGPWPKGLLTSMLEGVETETAIDVIAVFDVFTLPDVLSFRGDRQIDVVVR